MISFRQLYSFSCGLGESVHSRCLSHVTLVPQALLEGAEGRAPEQLRETNLKGLSEKCENIQ